MKKSKILIVLGLFYIITAILSVKTLSNVDNLIIYGSIISKYYSTAWYAFWILYGITVGIGLLMHKYIFWKLAIVQNIIFVINSIINLISVSSEELSLAFKAVLDLTAYRFATGLSIVFYFILFALLISRKKVFFPR